MARAQGLPSNAASKLTALRNRDRCYEMHRKRLKTIKPAIDNRAPPRRPHIRAKLKRRQLMEEWYDRVNRENRLLLERMASIAQRESDEYRNDSFRYSHSLNSSQRRRLLSKIAEENYSLLHRLQEAKPTYDAAQWEEDLAEHEERKLRISSFSGSHSPSGGSATAPMLQSRRGAATRSRHGGPAARRAPSRGKTPGELPTLGDALPRRPPTASSVLQQQQQRQRQHLQQQQQQPDGSAARGRARSAGGVGRLRPPSGHARGKANQKAPHGGRRLLPSPAGRDGPAGASSAGRNGGYGTGVPPRRGSPTLARPPPDVAHLRGTSPKDVEALPRPAVEGDGGDEKELHAKKAVFGEDKERGGEVDAHASGPGGGEKGQGKDREVDAAASVQSPEQARAGGGGGGAPSDGAGTAGTADAAGSTVAQGRSASAQGAGGQTGAAPAVETNVDSEADAAVILRVQAAARGRFARQRLASLKAEKSAPAEGAAASPRPQEGEKEVASASASASASAQGGNSTEATAVAPSATDNPAPQASEGVDGSAQGAGGGEEEGQEVNASPLGDGGSSRSGRAPTAEEAEAAAVRMQAVARGRAARLRATTTREDLRCRLQEPERRSQLVPGSRVEARFGGGAVMFPGTVQSVNADGSLAIAYDDGDREEGVAPSLAHALPPRLCDPARIRGYLVPGVAVLARFGGGADWFPGRIRGGDANQGYSIAYDDGDREEDVQLPLIRLVDTTPLGPGARVEARFGGGGLFFSGTVSAVSADNATVDVLYDDGDREQGVARALVRAID